MKEHDTYIETGFIDPGYWAECTCGWKGEVRDSEKAAYDDVVAHRAPPQPEDRL